MIHSKYKTNSENTIKRLSDEFINISFGIDEIIKSSWKIIEDNRTNVRSRLKTMSVIKMCYKYKMVMFETENRLYQMNNFYQEILMKEKNITKREHAFMIESILSYTYKYRKEI